MTNISYVLHAEDRDRLHDLMAILAPNIETKLTPMIIAECSNWAKEAFDNNEAWGRTISSNRGKEASWRKKNPDLALHIPGLTSDEEIWEPSLIDLLIAGLHLLDDSTVSKDEITIARLQETAFRLSDQANSYRRLVTSSIGQEGVSWLCGAEKALVMSPKNQLDLLSSIQDEKTDRDFPWLVLLGTFDQATCRSIWRAESSGGNLLEAADIKVIEANDREEVLDLLEDRTPVFFHERDYKTIARTEDTFIHTVFLHRFVTHWWRKDRDRLHRGIVGDAGIRNIDGFISQDRPEDWLAEIFLKLFMKALSGESRHFPPGGLARALKQGDGLPDLCGPELTN